MMWCLDNQSSCDNRQGIPGFNPRASVHLALSDALRAHHSLRWAIFNTTSSRPPDLLLHKSTVTNVSQFLVVYDDLMTLDHMELQSEE